MDDVVFEWDENKNPLNKIRLISARKVTKKEEAQYGK